jgi:hypothetical protein
MSQMEQALAFWWMCGPVIAAPKDTSSRVMHPQNAPAAPQPSHMLQVTRQMLLPT